MHVLGSAWPPLKFGALRIWDDGVTWNKLQPSSGSRWDGGALARLDALVKMARDHHVKPMLVLGQTPAWASSSPSAQGSYGPGAPAPPRRLSDWTRYVSFLAKRYRGQIEAYQVWNEPSFSDQWNGTVQQMAALTKAAHDAIKAADPAALVVSPGVPLENYKSMPFLRSYLPLVRDSIDVIGVHLYPAPHHAPESVVPLVRDARSIADAAGLRQPIWNTEENLGSRYSGDHYLGTKAAAWTARAILLSAESGVARSYWYAADDHVWGAVDLLNAANATPTMAGVAERVVATWLTGKRPVGCETRSRGATTIWSCRFLDGGGAQALAAWTNGGQVSIPPTSGARTLLTTSGARQHVGRMIRVGPSPVLVTP